MSKSDSESVFMDLPEGEAVFPWLNEADTKYNPTGDFKTGLRVPLNAALSTVRELERIRDTFYQNMSAKDQKAYHTVPVCTVELDDSGAETGNIIFNAKLHARGENKKTGETWDQAPKLWDCEGRRVAITEPPIWSGSVLALRVEARPYAMASSKTVGVSLRLRDVQIIELVTGGGGASPFAPRDGYRRPASDGDKAE